MASVPLGCSLPLRTLYLPSRQHKAFDAICCCASTASTAHSLSKRASTETPGESLKPIVVHGDPPTFVTAPWMPNSRHFGNTACLLVSVLTRSTVSRSSVIGALSSNMFWCKLWLNILWLELLKVLGKCWRVGDLHGDLDKARCALQMAGVLSSDGRDLWVGGQTVLVQLGDILDRGENEIAILSLLKSLDIQAKAYGGAVFQVNGNHETMNVEGDFRYVDSGAFDECAEFLEHLEICNHNWEEAFIGWVGVSKRWKEERKLVQNHWDPWSVVKRQKGVIARSILLRPGGPLASELARHAVVLKVNEWVFCHGGLLPHHVEYGIERINKEVSYWMKGLSMEDDYPELPFIATKGYNSVVWSRLYSRDTEDLQDYQINQIQSILQETLQALGAKGMVVGHTPQATGVNCEFNCRIWRIDVGMSSGVLDSRPEVLEIREGRARAIRSKRDGYTSSPYRMSSTSGCSGHTQLHLNLESDTEGERLDGFNRITASGVHLQQKPYSCFLNSGILA
ncbi:UNVERIFIED_CONTAM: Shewanella-like protein phosphatase 1 [Sesamum radiatum]|uniref:Shewanella-like protein phosphatase 1 n=1 Tax=Sesamum radiatum TaxID=300843 RepID=A0AAW2W2G9_SESRA